MRFSPGFIDFTRINEMSNVEFDIVMFGDMVYFANGLYINTLKRHGVGMGSTKTLHKVEFEVAPREDRGFKVEPLVSCDVGDGLQDFHTQDLIAYQLAHDTEQWSARESLKYRGDSNMISLGVVEVIEKKAHESLTFRDDALTCEVNSKWMVVMKEYMDTQS
ncbi:hypothetical protein Tco_1024585 [Tanacetum coccineum]